MARVTSQSSVETAGWIELGFFVGGFLRPISNYTGTSLWNFVKTPDFKNFVTASRSCCQQNSSMIDLTDCTCGGRRAVAGRTTSHIIDYTSVDRRDSITSVRR